MNSFPEAEVADEINAQQTKDELPLDFAHFKYTITFMQGQHSAPVRHTAMTSLPLTTARPLDFYLYIETF